MPPARTDMTAAGDGSTSSQRRTRLDHLDRGRQRRDLRGATCEQFRGFTVAVARAARLRSGSKRLQRR